MNTPELPPAPPTYQALLTENLTDCIRYGYGDPAVLRVPEVGPDGRAASYYLLVTSNDAPDAFPILRSRDLANWEPAGFVLPEGRLPGWALQGEGRSDFWAPELHRIGGAYIVFFTARSQDGALSIGTARSAHPQGPFVPDPQPLLAGGVIDPHVLIDADGSAFLFWKEDANDRWPGLLAELLHRQPELLADLYPDVSQRRTAALCLALWPSIRMMAPMERFLALQPLIEATTSSFQAFQQRLAAAGDAADRRHAALIVRDVSEAMRTPIHAQRLTPDARGLAGPRHVVLMNDQAWEAHLVEGPWVTCDRGKYYLFYAGNDFTTADYGIGVAVAESALGPYVKSELPLLKSTAQWWGPGHPSVADGLDGRPQLFFHAFSPGRTGYKAFRALLTVPIAFEDGRVVLRA